MAKGKKGAKRITHVHVDKFQKDTDEQRTDLANRAQWDARRKVKAQPKQRQSGATKRSVNGR